MARKGRSLESLGLVSAPVSVQQTLSERSENRVDPAIAEAEWAKSRKPTVEQFLHAIEMMRGDGRWEWCDDTLTGIYDSVHRRQDLTLNQKMAVEHLYAKIAKHWENDFDVFMREA